MPSLISRPISAPSLVERYYSDGDYLKTSGLKATDSVEAYLILKSQLLLGTGDAQTTLPPEFSTPFTASLFEIQRLLIQKEDTETAEDLLSNTALPDVVSPLMAAEYFAVCALRYCMQDRWRQAISHLLRARDEYRKAGATGREAVTLFNLCTCYHNLNERELFDLYFQDLAKIADESKLPTVQLHYLRLKGHRLIEASEFLQATTVFGQLISLSEKEGRQRDIVDFLFVQVFLKLKSGRCDLALDDVSRIFQMPLTPLRAELALQWKRLSEEAFIHPTEAFRLLRHWKKREFTGTNKLLLISCLTETFLKSKDYETVLRLCEMAETLALKNQICPSLFDFWEQKTKALLALGSLESAQKAILAFAPSPNSLASRERLTRLHNLQSEFERRTQLTKESPPQKVSGPFLSLDTHNHKLLFNEKSIDLTTTPKIEELLAILIAHPQGLDPAELFSKLYSVSFHPERHSHRLHSLVTRARKLLGEASVIERRNGKIGLSMNVLGQMLHAPSVRRRNPMEKRSILIRNKLKSSPNAISISELERSFSCTRRTLQNDLKRLLHLGVIASGGNSRNRTYFIKEGQIQ